MSDESLDKFIWSPMKHKYVEFFACMQSWKRSCKQAFTNSRKKVANADEASD